MTAIPPKGTTNHTPIKCLLTIFVNGFTRGTTRYASPRYRKWLFRLPLSFSPSTSFFSAPFYSPGSVVIFRGRATITCSHYHRLFIGLLCYVDDRISPLDLTRLFLFFTIVRRFPFPRLLTEFHRGTMRHRDVCDDWLHQKGLRDIITVYPESENQDWKRKVKSEKRKVEARGARRYTYWEATLTTTSRGNENEGNRRHVCVRTRISRFAKIRQVIRVWRRLGTKQQPRLPRDSSQILNCRAREREKMERAEAADARLPSYFRGHVSRIRTSHHVT